MRFLRRSDAEKLERAVLKARMEAYETMQTVRLDYPGAEIVLDSRSKLARKRNNAARKEPFTVAWIESLPPGDVLYDIGANVGGYALIAARRPQGPLRVVAFEPGFANYATLCTNLMLNHAGADVLPLPVTLGDEPHLGEFRYSDVSAGAARHGVDAPIDAAFAHGVLVERLDDVAERFTLPPADHLKIDVDGAEVAVLRGAERVLGRVSTVMVELSDAEAPDADALLAAAGLRRTQKHTKEREPGEAKPFWYALYERGPEP